MSLALASSRFSHPVAFSLPHAMTREVGLTLSSRGCFFSVPPNPMIDLKALLTSLSFRADAHLLQCTSFKSTDCSPNEIGFFHSIFREIGFSEEAVDLLLLEIPSLRLTSSDKIRSRLLSLQTLSLDAVALHRLVTNCPNVLIAEEIEPLIGFLLEELEGQLEPALVERLFTATDTRFLAGFHRKVKLLLQHGVPKEKIAYFLNKVNLIKFLRKKSVEDVERIISLFHPFGGIDVIVKLPAILNCDLDSQLIPRIKFLRDLSGGDDYATETVFRRLPAILTYSVEHMQSHVGFLQNFAGLSHEEIFKIILVFPNVISTSKERKLNPRIQFLKQCSLDSQEIFKFLTKAPLFLALSGDNLTHKLGFLVKIGYKHRTKEFAMAMGAVTRTSSENLQKVIGVYLSYGLSVADVLAMSKKHPQVLQYNHISLQEKMEYLREEMGREVEELLAFPAFLGYRLDGRIKQRFEANKSKAENISLNKLLALSAEKFSMNGKIEKL